MKELIEKIRANESSFIPFGRHLAARTYGNTGHIELTSYLANGAEIVVHKDDLRTLSEVLLALSGGKVESKVEVKPVVKAKKEELASEAA